VVHVVAGACRRPAQLRAEADLLHEADQRRVRRQDDVIEAVEDEAAEVVPGGETTHLCRALEHGDAVRAGAETLSQGEAHEAAADDPNLH
jgi:glutamine amidotransferase PdxT